MKKAIIWILLALFLLLAGAAGTVYALFVLPYQEASSIMPSDVKLTIRQDEEGFLHMDWPDAEQVDYYCLELQEPVGGEAGSPIVVYRDYVYDDSAYILPHMPLDRKLVLQINTVVEYETAGTVHQRTGEDPTRITMYFNAPTVADIQWTPDPDTDSVTLTYRLQDADFCRIYLVEEDGTKTLFRTLEEEQTQITFGEGMDLPMPGYEDRYTFTFDAYRIEEDVEFYGYYCGEVSVVREDLLGRDLALECTDRGNNVFTLTWQETKGKEYMVQQLDSGGEWVTVSQVPRDGERSYTTGHLENLSSFAFRVRAAGGQVMPDSQWAAVSEEVAIETGVSPVYCTVWPTSDLDAFSAPADGEVVGKVKTAKAYCVLDERDGMFCIRLDGQLCYIDSNYCLINLPELLGDLCSYNITNSYASLYMVHEYEIPEVTDTVIKGYEAVKLQSGEYLVPLLYPVTRKLLVAAQDAISRGYRLKIYDAFRPQKATVDIYEVAGELLEQPIPEKPFTDKKLEDMPTVAEGEQITYQLLMTNNEWGLGNFLAPGTSRHNIGVALDLTLERLDNGQELEMQTSIHDLSWYSVVSKNNENAEILAEIMLNADMTKLISEWWHFQDNEARDTLLPPAVWSGVTPECWMCDDNGWRYRRYNGSYFTNCVRTIDGVNYTFDENGYVQE